MPKRTTGPSVIYWRAKGLWELKYTLPINSEGSHHERGQGRAHTVRLRNKHEGPLTAKLPDARALVEAAKIRMATQDDIERWINFRLLETKHAEVIFKGFSAAKQMLQQGSGAVNQVDFGELREFYEAYILDKETLSDANRSTHYNHMNMYDQVAAWVQENHPRLDMTEADVEKYIADQRRRWSDSTANKRLVKLRHMLERAKKAGWIKVNVAETAEVSVKKGKVDAPRSALMPDQVKRIWDRLEEKIDIYENPIATDYRTKPMAGCLPLAVALGVYAGLRNEEIRWLVWPAIKIREEGSRIIIGRVQCKKTGRVWTPKSGEYRTIGMNDKLKDIIIAHRDRLKKAGMRCPQFVIPGGSWRYARSGQGAKLKNHRPSHTCIPEKTLTRSFREFIANEADLKLGDPAPTFYSLRHTFATHLANNYNAPNSLLKVQKRMGHVDIETTMGYVDDIDSDGIIENCLPY